MQHKNIWVVDDDEDDVQIITGILEEVNQKLSVIAFSAAERVLQSLECKPDLPLLILCDMQLRGVDGLELREKILSIDDRHYHIIPFILMTTSASEVQVNKAFSIGVHGVFIKPPTYSQWKENMDTIVKYWSQNLHPLGHLG
jgi:CheY-like chemotaxis protein